MFDIGFTELLLIGIVSLVVIGPERLPDVARTAGRWIGKLQRFVRGVKSDIAAELETGELKKLIGDQREQIDELSKMVRSTARELESTTGDVVRDARRKLGEMEEATKRIDADAETLEKTVDRAEIEADDDEARAVSEPRPGVAPARPEIARPGGPVVGASGPDDGAADSAGSGSDAARRVGSSPGVDAAAESGRDAVESGTGVPVGADGETGAPAPVPPADGTAIDEPAPERARGGGG